MTAEPERQEAPTGASQSGNGGGGYLPEAVSVAVHASIEAISPAEWNSLRPSSPENWAYYRAVEEAPSPAATHAFLAARAPDGTLLSAAPVFSLDYRLDTPFQGRIAATIDRFLANRPGLARLPVVGLGSPTADSLRIGFAPALGATGRRKVFGAMLAELTRLAHRRGASVVAIKSVADPDPWLDADLGASGFRRVTSVPVVTLPLLFSSLDQYLASLPNKTGAYLRRKQRSQSKLRIEYRDTACGLEDRIEALYEATLAQSGVGYGDLDRLPRDFFEALLRRQGDTARLMLCWLGDELVSFQVFIMGTERIVAYKIGMKYPEARDYNLYFINWLQMIELAIERKIPEIEMGATAYASKLLFGGHLERRWLYFRFRNSVGNALLQPLRHVFDFERNDPELTRLAGERTLPWGRASEENRS